MYDKMLQQVERDMNEETHLLKNFNRADKIKAQKKK